MGFVGEVGKGLLCLLLAAAAKIFQPPLNPLPSPPRPNPKNNQPPGSPTCKWRSTPT